MKCLVLGSDGKQRMTTVTASASLNYYVGSVLIDQDIGTGGAGFNSAHTVITLPNSKTYTVDSGQLIVFNSDGEILTNGVHYTETSSTTITLTDPAIKNIRIIFWMIS